MVRMLTGAAIQVAQGRLRIDDHMSYLDSSIPQSKSPYCAPADGLTLEKVEYG